MLLKKNLFFSVFSELDFTDPFVIRKSGYVKGIRCIYLKGNITGKQLNETPELNFCW